MKRINIFIIFSAVVAGLVLAQPAAAQFFNAAGNRATVQSPAAAPVSDTQAAPKADAGPSRPEAKHSVVETAENTEAGEVEKQPVNSPFDYAYGKKQSQPQAQKPQEPFRRYSQVGGITVETTEDHPEDELIMLFMRDFSIYRSPSGRIRCSARFAVMTTLPVKLSNISYRLKWPGMETVLTFSDVEPGVENHFDYGLLGDGCYSMDKQPNIIVNRCRVKGMTQRQCAAKIRWLKEI